jgi:Tfp pilus assembly protein PilN
MIEINLLPGGGGGRKARSRGGGGGVRIDLKAIFSGLSGKFTDKWLLAAVAASAAAALVIGMLYSRQTYRAVTLAAAEEEALKDSTRLAIALAEKIKAEAIRDTALRQINIIRSIDDDRFVWPHVLDEVSRALTPYTWIVSIGITDAPQGTVNVVAAPPGPGGKVDTTVARETIKLRIIGQTVDIQALTRFMRQLEASPFLANITLERSEVVLDGNKEITQFALSMLYTRPDPSTLRRVPLTITGPTAAAAGD